MNYQWNTISSTNGQTPFVSLFMYINEQKMKEVRVISIIDRRILNNE